jgi:hypothetical protein
MADVHYFDIEVAKRYGVNCAVLLQNIWHWTKHNEANDKHFHDGFYWTYNSSKAFQELFPYLSQRQIETALKKLRDEDVIKTGNYNAVAYDRTLWYAITEKGKSILHTGEMENADKGNGNDTEVKPIPYINTSNKTADINKKERKTSYDEILSSIEDAELKALYLEYIKMRKLIKSPMTDRALQMLIKRVNDLEPDSINNQKQMLETAIMNNWKSVYPIKREVNNGQSNNASNKKCGDEYAFLG